MSKRLCFLISFVLVMCLVGNVSAQPIQWTGAGGDYLWCTPANWEGGELPSYTDYTVTPYPEPRIDILMTSPVLISADQSCLPQGGMVVVGDTVDTVGVDGTTLLMTDGEAKFTEIVMGYRPGGVGKMVMNGGHIQLEMYAYVGVGDGGDGTFIMTGGTIDCNGTTWAGDPMEWASALIVPKNETGDGTGYLQMDGGVIRCRRFNINDRGLVDMRGGKIIVTGNIYGDDYIDILQYVADGKLIAYGGTGSVGVAIVEPEDPCDPNEVWVIGRYYGTAWLPQPSDGAIDILRDVVLRWQPGDVQATNGHKLYFADNFTDVNSRSVTPAILSDTEYAVGQYEWLETAKTYYWAVDEVNGPNTWPGPVWRFTMDRGVAKDPDPADEAEDVNSRALTLSWLPGMDANDVNGHEVYFGTSYAEVNDANTSTPVVYRGPDDVLGPDVNDRYSYVIPGGDLPFALGETYYWRIDEVNDPCLWKGDVWRFEVEGKAHVVYPADGAVDIPALNLLLRWEAGTGAAGHDVYFGSDEAAVEDANTSNTAMYPGVFRGNQPLADVNYPLENLDVIKTYYWRIDEVNTAAGTLIKGKVWSFTTGLFLIVDSFEPFRYVDIAALRAVWTTGHLLKNGAELFVEVDPDFVRARQSMRFAYRNYQYNSVGPVRYYVGSEAVASTADLEIGGSDWTAGGVKALVVNFYGDAGNAQTGEYFADYHITNDQMYVALEDGSVNVGVVKYDEEHGYDMNDIKKTSWQEWNIDLEDPCLIAVDMNNVVKVYIGFGGQKTGQMVPGAGEKSGNFDTVWFDDIRLYPPRCMPEMTGFLRGLGDIGGGEEGAPDCHTNYLDLEIMADDWLASDANVLATAPSDVNLVARWEFEGNFNDSNGSNDGVANGDVTTVYDADRDSNVLSCDGDSDYVSIPGSNTPGSVFDIRNAITLSAWIRVPVFENSWAAIVTKGDHSWRIARDARAHGLEFACTGIAGPPYGAVAGIIPVDDNLWHHAAGVYDGSKVCVYVDGIRDNCENASGLIDLESCNVWIGSNEDAPGSAWTGFIDDVRIYNVALQPGEIMVLAGKGGTLYVPLDVPANIVPKDPCDSEDPNLGTNAFDPNNLDIVNFLDYGIMAEHWLEQHPWP